MSHFRSAAPGGSVGVSAAVPNAGERHPARPTGLAVAAALAGVLLAGAPAAAQTGAAAEPTPVLTGAHSRVAAADTPPASEASTASEAGVAAETGPQSQEAKPAASGAAQAATEAAPAAPAADAAPAAAPAPSRPWPPAYQDRRFEENWAPIDWLAPPKSTNVFDRIKAIKLNDSGSVWVGFGGQARGRLAYQSTVNFGGPFDFEPTMWTWRFRGYTDLHLGKLRLFGEGIYSNSSIQALVDTFNAPSARLGYSTAPNLNGDVLNLFAEYSSNIGRGWNGGVWAGRRELQMGHERVLSPGNWLLNRHTFDGGGGWFGNDTHRVEAFVVQPTIPVPDQWNDRDDSTVFSGVFYTRSFVRQPAIKPGATGGRPQRVNIQPYVLFSDRKDVLFVQGTADESRYTMGMLAYGDVGATGFDFEFEGMYQSGRWQTQYDSGRIDAYSLTGEFGYRFMGNRFYPRPYVSVDYASGDGNQNDAKLGTFDPYYPLAYAFWGFHAAFERKNFVATGLHLEAVLARNLYFKTNYWPSFRRARGDDGVYDSFGNITRRPEPQSKGGDAPDLQTASMQIGQQWDVGVAWQMSRQILMYGTYLRFWAGQFWEDTATAPPRNMNGVMVLTQFNF